MDTNFVRFVTNTSRAILGAVLNIDVPVDVVGILRENGVSVLLSMKVFLIVEKKLN